MKKGGNDDNAKELPSAYPSDTGSGQAVQHA